MRWRANRVSHPQPPRSVSSKSSEAIRHSYTREYYLTDCGGYYAYQQTTGRQLTDERLIGVAAIASLRSSGRVLDLGCGRGELVFCFASLGHEVTAVDYSRDAIDFAERTFAGRPDLRFRAEIICESVGSLQLVGEYEVAVASDLIEHLNPSELDRPYQLVARHLSPTGIFVVHTYPNLCFFEYDYARRRRLAALRGESLPEQPRSRYELLMHINEQNPRVLRRPLSEHFPYVLLWFGEPDDMGGSLLRPFSRLQLAAARDLCAVASRSPVDLEQLRNRLGCLPLASMALRELRMAAVEPPRAVHVEEDFTLEVELDNRTPFVLVSQLPNPVLISYHWMLPNGTMAVHDGVRSLIQPPLTPGGRRSFSVRIVAPTQPGLYVLRLTIVQEGVRWFDDPEISVFRESPVSVLSRTI